MKNQMKLTLLIKIYKNKISMHRNVKYMIIKLNKSKINMI
jgi:hypothetical protein